MNDFVILDFVKLRERSGFPLTCGRYKRIYPVFQRFYSLWVESTGSKTEVGQLYMPCSINEKVLRRRQSMGQTSIKGISLQA